MKERNDYKVKPFESIKKPGVQQWQVIGGGVVVIQTMVESIATETAKNLNKDPYFLERGMTRKNRFDSKVYTFQH